MKSPATGQARLAQVHWLPRHARWAPGLLVLLGLATHLIGLRQPAEVTFDEVHWGRSVTA